MKETDLFSGIRKFSRAPFVPRGRFSAGYDSLLTWLKERGIAAVMQIDSVGSNIDARFDAIVATIVDSIARIRLQARGGDRCWLRC